MRLIQYFINLQPMQFWQVSLHSLQYLELNLVTMQLSNQKCNIKVDFFLQSPLTKEEKNTGEFFLSYRKFFVALSLNMRCLEK